LWFDGIVRPQQLEHIFMSVLLVRATRLRGRIRQHTRAGHAEQNPSGDYAQPEDESQHFATANG
jgi:hypothetical protein